MTIAKERVRDIRAMRNVPSKKPRALHAYNNTQVPNDNTHDAPNEGRAILRNGEAGFR
jgi:hypothetical protein